MKWKSNKHAQNKQNTQLGWRAQELIQPEMNGNRWTLIRMRGRKTFHGEIYKQLVWNEQFGLVKSEVYCSRVCTVSWLKLEIICSINEAARWLPPHDALAPLSRHQMKMVYSDKGKNCAYLPNPPPCACKVNGYSAIFRMEKSIKVNKNV